MQSRRDLGKWAAGAVAVAMAGPALVAAPGKASLTRAKPSRLKEGDIIGLIEPATASDEAFDLTLVEEAVRALGLVPKRAPNLMARFGYLAGTDRERAAGVNAMFADKQVKGVMAVRGGWGSARILPFLNYDMIRANPKVLIGYSDVTALHMALAAKSCAVSFHGPNGGSAWGKPSVEAFKALIFEGEASLLCNPIAAEQRLVQRQFRTQTIKGGKARGRLLGGNLTVLSSLLGTAYLPDFSGAILFLEDVDEAEYRIDRMLTQLGLAGILSKLTGVVFGHCTNCKGSSSGVYGGFPVSAVLRQHLEPLGVPAFQGSFIGHLADQFTIPQGIMAEIDADAGTIQLLEAAVI